MRSRALLVVVVLSVLGSWAPGASAAALYVQSVRLDPLNARSSTPVTLTVDTYVPSCTFIPCAGLTYAWDFGASTFTSGDTEAVVHTFGSAGLHPWAVRAAYEGTALTRTGQVATHNENWDPYVEAWVYRPGYQVTGKAAQVWFWVTDDSPSTGWAYALDTDADGDFNDGTLDLSDPGAGPHFDTSFAGDGAHEVRVRAFDGQGAATTTSFTVRTHTANEPPQPGLWIQSWNLVNQPVSVWDEGGVDDYTPTDQLVYEWKLDGQAIADTGGFFQRTFATPGHHLVDMKVTDGDGLSATDHAEFDVVAQAPPASAPDFGIYDDPAAGTPGLRTLQNIALAAADSLRGVCGGTEPCGLDWDLDGDGLYDDAQGTDTTVAFLNRGTYEVGLRVTRPGDAPVTIRHKLVVDVGPDYAPAPPVAQPETSPVPAPAAPAPPFTPAAPRPVGRTLLTAGHVHLTDGLAPGAKLRPGTNAPGINLARRALVLGSLFSDRAATVEVTVTTRLATARASVTRLLSLGRARVSLSPNTPRPLRLTLTAPMVRSLKRMRRITVTTRMTVTDAATRNRSARSRTHSLRVVRR